MRENEFAGGFVCALIVTVVCAVFLSIAFLAGMQRGASQTHEAYRHQIEAVEHNAAHWETASDGSTTFVWDEEVSE